MKSLVILFVFSILFLSKIDAQKVDVVKLKTHFISLLNKKERPLNLQEFQVQKLDTLTLKNLYYELYERVNNQIFLDRLLLDTLGYQIDSDQEMAKTFNFLSKKLAKPYEINANNQIKVAKKILVRDSLMIYGKSKLDSLLPSVDSVKTVGYIAKCLYNIKIRDKSVIKDTILIYIKKDLSIWTDNQYSEKLHEIFSSFTSSFSWKIE